ncbi:MAG: flagellar biosynthesis protein FlhA [Gaiellales bacterium]
MGFSQRLLKHSDLAAAVAVILVVAMMMVPLPTPLLDLLIAANIAGGLTIVIGTMYVSRALEFSSFPSLLLMTTLFRLAINVSVTRLILLHGDAGSVVHAFGEFVVGGNLVVGLVVFLILVVIQFAVITSGAGRVAEVAARFTLDAMPGKQMAIDADLNAGQITDEEARSRRAEIGREADFYGAMDGASKFVKGDAVAGVVIVAVNLIAGITIGVIQHGMPASEAVHTYSILTIGDALGAQIPALLISTATGILVTRSGSTNDLGGQITREILRQPRASTIAGATIAALALVPGLPKLPFLLIGGAVYVIGRGSRTTLAAEKREEEEKARQAEEVPAAPSPLELGPGALAIDPLELSIGFGLVTLVDESAGGSLLARIGVVRRQVANELGLVIGPVRVRDDVSLESHEYVVRVRGVEVARTRVIPGHRLAMDPGDAIPGLAGLPTVEPAFGLPAVWIDEAARAEAEALGYTVVDIESVVVTHLTEVIRRHADELLTRQETKALLDGLRELNAAAVEEVVPDRLSVGEVQRVLQSLLREGVSIRDLGTILESIGDKSIVTRDPAVLAEHARQALARQIVTAHVDDDRALAAITLDPGTEQEIAESLVTTADGELLALDPDRASVLVAGLVERVHELSRGGVRPVLVCSSRIRRHVRRLVEQALPQLAVLAYTEIVPGIRVESSAIVTA